MEDHGDVDFGAARNATQTRRRCDVAEGDIHQREDLIDGHLRGAVAGTDARRRIYNGHVRDWTGLKRQTTMMSFGFRFRGFELGHVRLGEADPVARQSQLAEQVAAMNPQVLGQTLVGRVRLGRENQVGS